MGAIYTFRRGIPPPRLALGCNCKGQCKPSKSCACFSRSLKDRKGRSGAPYRCFPLTAKGILRDGSMRVLHLCHVLCACSDSCANRVSPCFFLLREAHLALTAPSNSAQLPDTMQTLSSSAESKNTGGPKGTGAPLSCCAEN